MNDERRGHVPPPDALRRALRAASPEPPLDAVDWDALHGRVMAQATQILARTTVRRRWWDEVAAWASRGIPITAVSAAAAALVLVLGGLPIAPRIVDHETFAAVPMTLEDVLAAEAGPLFGDGSAEDALTLALLGYEGEEP